jgi:Ca-activated chloride channel family protein
VLTDVSIKIADVGQYDVYPPRIGDLFKGQQVIVVGRYKQIGPRAITLSGKLGAGSVSFVYEASFGSEAKLDFLPRLWAVRKVGFLLNEIRRNGENAELVRTIRNLGLRHGIVTPYTSFLVVEEHELRRRGLRPAGLGGAGDDGDAPATAADMEEAKEALKKKTASGRGAVTGARLAGKYLGAERDELTGVGVKTVGVKTFRLKTGVWIDTAITESTKAETVSVKYLSTEYDELLEDETLARYLSVGDRVELLHNGKLYTITR